MLLEVRDLACGYSPKKPVVSNVNFRLDEGDVMAILGPNGVGKTTVFKAILNLAKPLAGQICVRGENTVSWSPKKIASIFAYVAQSHIPTFPYLVKDVALMGRLGQNAAMSNPSREDYEIVEQALEDVGIRHLRDKVYTEISGGERQLLMIARALAQQPKIVIMDEPTANLDYGNMLLVIECIKKLSSQGLCIVFTTHMPDQAFMCANKVELLIRNGPAIFGDVADVITEKNLNEAYGKDIRILDVVDANGYPMRVVAPGFMARKTNKANEGAN
jgi:iron complex transport system ATP-binding protein